MKMLSLVQILVVFFSLNLYLAIKSWEEIQKNNISRFHSSLSLWGQLSVQTLQNGSARKKDKPTQTKRKENITKTTEKENKQTKNEQQQTGEGSSED